MVTRISTLNQIRLRTFGPVDRNTPLFEAIVGDDVIFDVGEEDGRIDIAFHESAARYTIDVDIFDTLLADAIARITASAASAE